LSDVLCTSVEARDSGATGKPARQACPEPVEGLILEGRFAAKDTIKVDCKGGVMKFEKG
jgi:hypothetical protein